MPPMENAEHFIGARSPENADCKEAEAGCDGMGALAPPMDAVFLGSCFTKKHLRYQRPEPGKRRL